MSDLIGALAVGIAIFSLSTLAGVVLYFLFKDYVKEIFRK